MWKLIVMRGVRYILVTLLVTSELPVCALRVIFFFFLCIIRLSLAERIDRNDHSVILLRVKLILRENDSLETAWNAFKRTNSLSLMTEWMRRNAFLASWGERGEYRNAYPLPLPYSLGYYWLPRPPLLPLFFWVMMIVIESWPSDPAVHSPHIAGNPTVSMIGWLDCPSSLVRPSQSSPTFYFSNADGRWRMGLAYRSTPATIRRRLADPSPGDVRTRSSRTLVRDAKGPCWNCEHVDASVHRTVEENLAINTPRLRRSKPKGYDKWMVVLFVPLLTRV